MQAPPPLTRDLVLLGGGHAHALVLRRFAMRPVPGLRITLVDPAPKAPYTGMLPGYVAGHYTRDALDIDLVRLARLAGAGFIPAAGTGIDRDARRLMLSGRPDLRYDRLSIDIGAHGQMPALPGFDAHAHAVKPMAAFAQAWENFVDKVNAGGRAAQAVVIGGGVAGVELALAMAHRLGEGAELTIVERAGGLLPEARPATRRVLMQAIQTAGINIKTGVDVSEIHSDSVRLTDGTSLASAFTAGAGGVRPYAWLEGTGLALEGGYIAVDRQLRTLNDPNIYAAGDCAALRDPRPKAGVYAVRAAKVLERNLRGDLTGRARVDFRPQRRFLKLISTGDKSAVAQRGALQLSGRGIWRWKDRIDRRFMDQFRTLEPMARDAAPSGAAAGVAKALSGPVPCAGCGAKVGADALGSALGTAGLAPGIGDDAAVANLDGQSIVMTTDHMPAVTQDLFRFGQIVAAHALGDIWAMAAQPRATLATLVLPRMTPDMQSDSARQILAGATSILGPAGAPISGGHTTQGAELMLGFTVIGTPAGPLVTLAGAQRGDALILTKPIGSGTLLAGEMAGKADGQDVIDCLEAMARDQSGAADILSGAHAMTDVTGFGLAGHLANILRASSVGAELDLAAIPLLKGAGALTASGVRSTLFADNRAYVPELEAADTPRAALLFDPQTSGGLLAAVAPQQADDLCGALREAGHAGVRIGRIVAESGIIAR